MSLSHRALATPAAAGCMHVRQLYGVSSDTLVRLASELSEQCVKKQCGLAGSCFGGRMALDLRLSRVRTGVAAMGQDCNYQLGEIKGVQKNKHLRMKKATVFLGTLNTADIFWYPSPDLCLDTILSLSSMDNFFDLLASFFSKSCPIN